MKWYDRFYVVPYILTITFTCYLQLLYSSIYYIYVRTSTPDVGQLYSYS